MGLDSPPTAQPVEQHSGAHPSHHGSDVGNVLDLLSENRTFGKAIGQELPYPPGTIMYIQDPFGAPEDKEPERVGVRPDFDTLPSDKQLQEAIDALKNR